MREVTAHNIRDFHQKLKSLPEAYRQVTISAILFLMEKYLQPNGQVLIIGSCDLKVVQGFKQLGFEVHHYTDALADLTFKENEVYDVVMILDEMQKHFDLSVRLKLLYDGRRLLKDGGTAIVMYDNLYGTIKADYLYPSVFEGHYKSTPDLSKEEIHASQLHILSYAGAESMVSGMYLELNRLKAQNRREYNQLVQLACQSCEQIEYRDGTEHLIFVLRK